MTEDTSARGLAQNRAGDRDGLDPDDPAELDAAAGRLEAALERIVRQLDLRGQDRAAPGRAVEEVTARLDKLITRVRDALDSTPPY